MRYVFELAHKSHWVNDSDKLGRYCHDLGHTWVILGSILSYLGANKTSNAFFLEILIYKYCDLILQCTV